MPTFSAKREFSSQDAQSTCITAARDTQSNDTQPRGTRPPDPHWTLLQLADSALPCGGFAHSGGLEACYRLGHLRDHSQLESHLNAQLIQWARGVGPMVAMAFRDADRFAEADRLCDLLLNHPIANRASRLQGKGFFFAARHTFPSVELPPTSGHLAPTVGAVCRSLAIDEQSTLRLFFFMQLRGVMAAAIRLGIIGPMAAGAMQQRLLAGADWAVKMARETDPEDAGQTAPLAELFAANHDRLYSRLFQS